jgi:hypothetical protein
MVVPRQWDELRSPECAYLEGTGATEDAVLGASSASRRLSVASRRALLMVFDPGSPWNEVGIHGIQRAREWDAVVTADAPDLSVDEVHFVAVPSGDLIGDEKVLTGSLAPLARAVEEAIQPPYRAHGIRRNGAVWAVGALGIEVVTLPASFEGDELELVARDGQRVMHVDGMPAFDVPRELDALARDDDSVVRARRLAATLWEVEVDVL